MFRSKCLVCGSARVGTIIDLGIQPFADSFIPQDRLSEPDPAYPLVCALCRRCGHVQTSCVTNPGDRYFQLNDYSYTSSNSATSRSHWKTYAHDVTLKVGLPRKAFVVEVGSNDGFLASQFRRKGCKVLGVDASVYMARLAAKRKIRTEVMLFGKRQAEGLRRKHGAAELVIANNVFNHADDPVDFVKGVAAVMSRDGWFVFEQPYWLASISQEKIDQVYHEHVSYFTVASLRRLLRKAGLTIVDAVEVNYHGGSLRVYAKKAPREKLSHSVRTLLAREEAAGLFDPATYAELMAKLLHRRNVFLQEVFALRAAGHPIIAIGAPAKGNTFLNFYRLDNSVVDYVTDSSPHKKGKFTPLTRIPIVDDGIFRGLKKPYALVLSWNLMSAIKAKLKTINPKIRYISPEANQESVSK